jgi:hypothetical protein
MAKIKKIDDELKLASQGVKTATDNFNNMSYDNFKQGSMYQGLQKSYSQQGQQAMKDTLGQVAARTGGMASSYANTASQQAYNNYMQQLEDVARAMYNDEYSKARDKVSLAQNEYDRLYGEKRDAISDQRYEDEQAYLKGRDELSDQRYNTEREEARVANDAYYGNALDYKTYQANGGTLSEQAYNSIVAAAKGKYTDDHWEQDLAAKAARDTELMGRLGAEDFLWGDWNGDGIVGDEEGKTFEDLYGGSSYGEDYWKAYAEGSGAAVLPVAAKFEEDIAELDAEEAEMFMQDLGLTETGLNRLIRTSYDLLGYISFLTAGEDDVHAWTIVRGTKAQKAAGKIHTDIERGFIRAEIVAFEDLKACGSMAAVKEKGLFRLEGKEYVMQDGDVTMFRFNV